MKYREIILLNNLRNSNLSRKANVISIMISNYFLIHKLHLLMTYVNNEGNELILLILKLRIIRFIGDDINLNSM